MGRKSFKQVWAQAWASVEATRQRQVKANATRIANGTNAKPRQTCKCAAYPWPHRPGGGNCRYLGVPTQAWKGKAGRHPFGTFGRVSGGSSSIRRAIIKRYGFHPIRDRQRIRRWLPKLYAALSRREGYPWVYQAMGGWVPAMLVTDKGIPAGIEPYNGPDLWPTILQGTSRKWDYSDSPARRRKRHK